MRKIHRWIMTVVVLLTTYWSLSGLTLAVYDLADHNQTWAFDGGGFGATGSGAGMPPLPAPRLAELVKAIEREARSAAPTAPFTALTLRMRHGEVEGVVDLGDTGARQLVIDPVSGKLVQDSFVPDPLRSLHTSIKSWHRGNIIGSTGIWLALGTGLALIAMIVTGLVMYGRMYVLRLKLGRRAVFW